MADSVDCKQVPTSIGVPGAGEQFIHLRAGYAASSRYHGSSFACGTPHVVIDVAGTHPEADVLDIEPGDATPASAPGWVKRHNALNTGFPAILYCNRSTLRAVANACAAEGLLPDRDFHWWIATLDGTTRVPDMTGVVAVQVWGAQFFPGHNIDLSIVYDDSWKASGPVPPNYPQIPGVWKQILNYSPMPGDPTLWYLVGVGTDNKTLWAVQFDQKANGNKGAWGQPYVVGLLTLA